MSKDPIGFSGGNNWYAYCGNEPVNWIDSDGHFPWLVAGVGVAVATPIIMQGSINAREYFGYSDKQLANAIVQNHRAMNLLQIMINCDGGKKFRELGLHVGGRMGMILPGNSDFQHLANLYEDGFNIRGWGTGLNEGFERWANDAEKNDYDMTTPDQRVELAKALLFRQQSFDHWLRRDFAGGLVK
jgi:hypothetical protein